MPNPFEKLRAWHAGQVRELAGVPVTYARGPDALALTAVVGRTVFAAAQEGKAAVVWGDRDYLIAVADLPIGPPRVGDRITEVIDGAPVVFEVQMPTPASDEPAWRYSDSQRTRYRVHVKKK